MKRITVLSTMVVSLMMLAVSASRATGQFLVFENPLVGKAAPDFSLNTLSGEKMNFTKARSGQPVVVFFWATWCPHCREQLKDLSAQAPAIEQKGIKLMLVDLGETKDQVQRYAKKQGIQGNIFLDEESSVAEQYHIIGVPTFFFVDKTGVIKSVEHALPEDFEKILIDPAKKNP